MIGSRRFARQAAVIDEFGDDWIGLRDEHVLLEIMGPAPGNGKESGRIASVPAFIQEFDLHLRIFFTGAGGSRFQR